MTGPSANGSENGTPTSRMSAPPLAIRTRMSRLRSRSGSPAVTYVTKPTRPALRRSRNAASIRDMSLLLKTLLHRLHVLVAAAGQVDEEHGVLAHSARDLHDIRNRMRRFERR